MHTRQSLALEAPTPKSLLLPAMRCSEPAAPQGHAQASAEARAEPVHGKAQELGRSFAPFSGEVGEGILGHTAATAEATVNAQG